MKKSSQLGLLLIGLIVVVFSSILIPGSYAAEFDPSYILSNSEMTDYNSMDISAIQRFLDKREGTLDTYICTDKEGNLKTATQAFYEIAQRWMINPKYLLALVQKEMSLLTHPNPEQNRYDLATGYGCPDSGGCDERWRGFYKQVNSAAAQFRYYLDNIKEFTYQPDKTYSIDGQVVTPKNLATASLYNYTPHISGNKNLWNIWNNYFGKKWPDGTLLRSSSTDTTYLISGGQKRQIISKSVLLSRFDTDNIIDVTAEDLNAYEDGQAIKFHNFSLLRNPAGEIYLVVNDEIRKIESYELFKKIGFKDDEIVSIGNDELSMYKAGPNITQYSIYPAGALLQDGKTKSIYYVLSSTKRLVKNQEILDANFHGLTIKKVTATELDQYLTSNPVTLPDGMLVKVKGSSTVFVISNGQRLPIFSGEIFTKMNYQWKNIVTVSKDTLDVHPTGQMITGDW